MAKDLTISKVSSLTGMAVDTIRFYERKGLIPHPSRNHAGYRIYTAAIVERIEFIKRARGYGFSLGEIDELLAIAETGPGVCSGMKERIERRIAEIDDDIEQLAETRRRLAGLTDVCADCRPCNGCHLVNTIALSPL